MIMIKYVTIEKFAELTGYTDKAVRDKMYKGVFVRGKHYQKAPDGRVLINLEEYQKWVESQHLAA